jgi:hypothetical protein
MFETADPARRRELVALDRFAVQAEAMVRLGVLLN